MSVCVCYKAAKSIYICKLRCHVTFSDSFTVQCAAVSTSHTTVSEINDSLYLRTGPPDHHQTVNPVWVRLSWY